ncbi:MAG: ClpX C4-type zinc finger protein [Deltaproteobacteria bacterium]|nr:ClpX C4-type zinc finger protein [Deltaproteobacteria bacterium]
MTLNRNSQPCSFCGRDTPLHFIVAGPGVNICHACVWLCAEELEGRGHQRPEATRVAGFKATEGQCCLCQELKTGIPLRDRVACPECAVLGARAFLESSEDAVARVWRCRLSPELANRRKHHRVSDERDAETYADLAIAFLEMKVIPDAFLEAAFSMMVARDVVEVGRAVSVLLCTLDEESLGELRSLIADRPDSG